MKLWRVQRDIIGRIVLIAAVASLVNGERAYPLGCSQRDPSYYNYDAYTFPPPGSIIKSTDAYLLVRKLGSGKFSDVFEAVDVELERKLPTTQINHQVDPRALVVLKCLKPVAERKIRREILILSHCSTLPNLARFIGLVVVPPTLQQNNNQSPPTLTIPVMPTLVLQHAGVTSQWLCHHGTTTTNKQQSSLYLTEYEIQYYLYHLLIALDALHSCGIMHRDVKPRNVLINRRSLNKKHNLGDPSPLMLIDLGLADFFLPNTRYNVRVASRHFKSPELLIGLEYYDYAIDIWGVGCILAGLLLRKEPFFRGMDNFDQLGKIIGVLGTYDLLNYMTKYKVELTPDLRNVVAKYILRGGQKQSWASMIPAGCPLPSANALDLLNKILVYNHDDRLTAKQAIEHSFFDEVRDRVNEEVKQRAIAEKAKIQSSL
jgi:casein kinase II subunit alpha